MVTTELPVPDEGEALSQFPPNELMAVTFQLKVPPPMLEMVSWSVGLAAPCCAANVNEVGLTARTAGAFCSGGVIGLLCRGAEGFAEVGAG